MSAKSQPRVTAACDNTHALMEEFVESMSFQVPLYIINLGYSNFDFQALCYNQVGLWQS